MKRNQPFHPKQKRPLCEIALEIRKDWNKMSPHAHPYWKALFTMNSALDYYGLEDGQTIIAYFLNNAITWRGDVARRVKIELKDMLK